MYLCKAKADCRRQTTVLTVKYNQEKSNQEQQIRLMYKTSIDQRRSHNVQRTQMGGLLCTPCSILFAR